MKKKKYLIYLFFLTKIVFVNEIVGEKTNGKIEIKGIHFDEKSYCYFMKFSAYIEFYNNTKIVIPIFRGSLGKINRTELLSFIKQSANSGIPGNLCFPLERGKVKETFFEFVNFYKKSLLKNTDIDHPTDIGVNTEVRVWEIAYDFDYDGVHGTMVIYVPGGFNKKQFHEVYKEKFKANQPIEDIREIQFDEKSNLHWNYMAVTIHFGEVHPAYEKWKKRWGKK